MANVTIKIDGEITYTNLIQHIAENYLRASGFTLKNSEGFGLAIREAFINAVKYGCQMDPQKSIKIAFARKKNHVEVKIIDPGKGFDADRIADPTTKENRMKVIGRGVFLMRSLSDNVEFKKLKNGKGMQVKLLKKIPLEKMAGR